MDYGTTGLTASAATATGTLAVTGISSLWFTIAAVTLMGVGLALKSLVPKEEF